MLGIPKVTLEKLYNRFDQKEPIVIDALRENAHFIQLVEGYPSEFNAKSTQDLGSKVGLHVS